MTITYFRHQICEELDGAYDYIKQALELRADKPSWSKQFADMSSAELTHSSNLYKMFEEFFTGLTKEFSDDQRAAMPWLDESRKEIIDMYTEKYTKVKAMYELYTK